MINILFTNFHPDNGGGHRTYLNYLFNCISDNDNINVFIASPEFSRLNLDLRTNFKSQVFNVDFPGKLKNIIQIFENIKILAKIIKQNNINIVHTNGNPDHKIVMLCKWIYKFDFKIVRTKHDTFPIKKKFFSKILFSKFTDHLILVSHYQHKQLDDVALLNKTTIIHNGVDLNFYKPQKKSKDVINDFNIYEADIVFVSVAGTNLNKGWPLLLEALSRLDRNYINRFKVIMAGKTPPQKDIDLYVKKFNLEGQVIFPGLVDDIRQIVSVADFGFVLSQKEALSYACREMMAMGVPVLITSNTGLTENVTDGKDGWIVNSSIDEIESFLKSLSLINKEEFSESAYKKAHNEFDLSSWVNKTMSVYNNLS
jgi:L-malate glycosyltransferase